MHLEPGTQYSDSNGNFRLVADMLEERLGQPFGSMLLRHVARPAGMEAAVFADETARLPGDAVGYEGDPELGFIPAVEPDPLERRCRADGVPGRHDRLGTPTSTPREDYAASPLGRGPMTPVRRVGRDVWILPTRRSMDSRAPGDWTVTIARDASGRPESVTIGCWLARNVRFHRVPDLVA